MADGTKYKRGQHPNSLANLRQNFKTNPERINRKGRPSVTKLREAIKLLAEADGELTYKGKTYTYPTFMEMVLDWFQMTAQGKAESRLNAITKLMDYHEGKPLQAIDMKTEVQSETWTIERKVKKDDHQPPSDSS